MLIFFSVFAVRSSRLLRPSSEALVSAEREVVQPFNFFLGTTLRPTILCVFVFVCLGMVIFVPFFPHVYPGLYWRMKLRSLQVEERNASFALFTEIAV